MKKFEKAFAIALIIISIIGTVWETDIIENIIYAVVIPSFILFWIFPKNVKKMQRKLQIR